MGLKLVEIHLPGHNYDKVNILPREYHGALNILLQTGLSFEQVVVVAYSTQQRDVLAKTAEEEGRLNITYTGTYGELPPENLDELLTGNEKKWDIVITGRYWGACHLMAFGHLLLAIKQRRPNHANFHFIKPLIDGINTENFTDVEKGSGSYTSDAFHMASILRILEDGFVRHQLIKDGDKKINYADGSQYLVKNMPATLTSIDMHFWTNVEKFVSALREDQF